MPGIHFHHALGTAPVLPVFANMVFWTLSGRLSAQCAATSFWCCVFTTFFFGTRGQCVEHLERSSGLQSGSPWTLTYVIVCFLVFKNLKNRIGVLVAVLQQLQVFKNHWMSLWLKFESLERTLGQDTNNWHLQQGSLNVCELYSWLLDFWPIEARRQSSNGAISWAICFATSNLVGVSSNESPSHDKHTHTRYGTGRSDKSKDATHGWVPLASTKALRCTEGDPTFAFRSATPLWSSIGQLQQNEGWISFCRDRRDGQNFVHKLVLKQHNLQLMLVRMTNESKAIFMLHVRAFLAVRGSFLMICLVHKLPNACLVGFKSLFHGSTFSEEQVWKWGGASWHASIVTNHLSPLLSFYPTKRTCLCSDLWLHWHAEHVNSRTRVYVGSTRKQNSKITPTYHGDAMAKYGNGFNPLTLVTYIYVLLRFDAIGTHSTCVEVWQQLDEHSIIHESTIGQVCQFANTLGFGTQVFWVVEHSWRFHVVDGLPKHDKTSWLFRGGFKSLISIALVARVHKSPLHKVVASGLSCISHKLSTVRTCVKWWVLQSIKQMKHVKSQS